MRKLKLVGLSPDGQQVVFVDDTGTEFVAPADERLHAALRGDRARLGQLEIEMHSALRPRDIQARIRAGESPETVAAMAQVSVEKILPYCVPVLAERAHIAELARRSHVRRRGADGPARRLADVVTERLQSRSVDPASAQWEAWRRDDGRWLVQVTYSSGERERSAHFAFDPDGRYSIADDDEAKWLTGERQSSSKGPQPRDGSKLAERRLAAVPAGDDLLNLPDDDRASEVDEGTDDLTAVIRAVHESPAQREFIPEEAADESGSGAELEAPTSAETPREEGAGHGPAESSEAKIVPEAGSDHPEAHADSSLAEPVPSADVREGDDAAAAQPEQSAPATVRRKRSARRASVPTWDEIMFGKGKPD